MRKLVRTMLKFEQKMPNILLEIKLLNQNITSYVKVAKEIGHSQGFKSYFSK